MLWKYRILSNVVFNFQYLSLQKKLINLQKEKKWIEKSNKMKKI